MLLSELMQQAPSVPGLDPDSVRMYRHRFRLGPIDRAELSRLGGAVVVHVEAKDFAPGESRTDRRPRDLISHEPERLDSDHQRIRRWWQMREEIQHWVLNPRSAPELLIGATGAPHELWIMGSIRLDHAGWTDTLVQRNRHRMHELPTMGNPSNVSVEMLDWRCLRGRRLAADVLPQVRFGQPRRGFGPRRGQVFDIVRSVQDIEHSQEIARSEEIARADATQRSREAARPAVPVRVDVVTIETPVAEVAPVEVAPVEAAPVEVEMSTPPPLLDEARTVETSTDSEQDTVAAESVSVEPADTEPVDSTEPADGAEPVVSTEPALVVADSPTDDVRGGLGWPGDWPSPDQL